MAGEPPFFRQRAERSGTSPLRHLLQLEGCLQRTAPVAELLVVDARTSAACPKQLSTKGTSQEEKGDDVGPKQLEAAGPKRQPVRAATS
jgi:hypothetical protein